VSQHRLRRRLLLGPQSAAERNFERNSAATLVLKSRFDLQRRKDLAHLVETTSGQRNVFRMVLGRMNDSRLVVSRKPHCLRTVKLGVLKSRETNQTIPQRSRKSVFGDVDLVGENQLNGFWQWPGNPRSLSNAFMLLHPSPGIGD
jgi:hypothetical protein